MKWREKEGEWKDGESGGRRTEREREGERRDKGEIDRKWMESNVRDIEGDQ